MRNLNQSIISKLNVNTFGFIQGKSKLTKEEKKDFEAKAGHYLKALKKKRETEIMEAKKREDKTKLEAKKTEAKSFGLSLKKYLELQTKGKNILSNFHTHHSMGCYRRIKLGDKVFVSNNVLDDYSKGCKYAPTYGDICLTLTKKELESIELIGRVPTLRIDSRKCRVLESSGSKQSYKVEWKEMFLIGTSHANTLEEAIRLEKLKRHSENIRKVKEKAFIGVQDIKQLGACDIGINQFCERNGLNKEFGYTVEHLLSLNDSQNYFKRLIG